MATASRSRRLRDELLNGEIFYNLKEAQIVIEQWRTSYELVAQKPAPKQVESIFHFRRVDDCDDMRRPAMPSTIWKITCQKPGVLGKKFAEVNTENGIWWPCT